MSISDLHRGARHFAELGFDIFPCHPFTKQPAVKRGFYEATNELAQIDKWWTENPHYNIAMVPDAHGLHVIDIDRGAAGDWCNGYELPPTFSVRTPSGGQHLWYLGSAPTSISRLAPHVDTRGPGSYVLLPPSYVIERDKGYEGRYLIDADIKYAQLMPWVGQKLAIVHERRESSPDFEPDRPNAVRLATQYIKAHDPIVQGDNSDIKTLKALLRVRDFGVSEEKAIELFLEHFRCTPLDEGWLREKAHNAYRYAQNEAGADAPDETPIAERFKNAPAVIASRPKRSYFYPEDDEEMDTERDQQWTVPGVIAEGSTVMLYGPTQSYKSFLALCLALGIATGLETFGVKPQITGPTFYGALEGRQQIKRARRIAWRLAHGVTHKTDFYVLPAPYMIADGEPQEFIEQIKVRAAGRMPRLIVLDTVSKMMAGLDPTRDAPKLMKFCDNLLAVFPGAAIMALHHTGHDVTRGPRDSSAYRAGFDTVLECTSPSKHVCEVRVIKHKDSDEPEAPFTFRAKPVGSSLVFERTTMQEHAKLIDQEDIFAGRQIYAVLDKRDARGEAKGISTRILFEDLVPLQQTQTFNDREYQVREGVKTLKKKAKGKLDGYCSYRENELIWHLPERKPTE